MINPYRAYQRFQPFREPEAWTLFKIAAIAEAIGWSALIGGILLRNLVLNGNGIPVTIAGRIHGTFFAAYILAVLALAPSLGWGWFKTLVAAGFSVPPFGSIVFELYAAQQRRRSKLMRLHVATTYHHLTMSVQ